MNNKSDTYRIGQVAKRLGLSTRAIRYYEEIGLIRPSRTEGGFRVFSEQDIELARLVIQFRDLGMALEDIRSLLLRRSMPFSQETLKSLKEALNLRRDEFEGKIAKYREGIRQIDTVLSLLFKCDTCLTETRTDDCNQCIKGQGEELSPLLDPITK